MNKTMKKTKDSNGPSSATADKKPLPANAELNTESAVRCGAWLGDVYSLFKNPCFPIQASEKEKTLKYKIGINP